MKSTTILKQALFLTSLCGLIAAATPSLRAADRLAAGKWEFTITTDGVSHTNNHCVTPAEANEVNGDAKTARDYAEKKAKGRCTIKSYDIQGNTVTSTLICDDRTIDSTITFHGDSSDSVLKTTTADGKVATTTVKARRLGACP
ncbi:MAG TPA: DUF3617 family protein [Thermoanaerobaculia bacterium]|nr:DUF3617 family protein [Thermoanaerobaculia bacterium]